jgi:MFS family permease
MNPHTPRPHLPASIWALGFVSLLMDVSSELIHSLLPVFMVTTLGISVFTVGLIEGAAEATALIVKVFSGALSDYWGKRKPLAILGYGLGALTKPLFALATSADWIVTARLADRVGKGIRGGTTRRAGGRPCTARVARRRVWPTPVTRHGGRVPGADAGRCLHVAVGQ